MAGENQGAVLCGIERLFNQGSLTGLTEGQLLRQFATGDEGAFEALVVRYGPMVLGVCRRLLYDQRDIEDAFQATFLILLRRSGSLGYADPLGPWLHGVAYRVAARIRSNSARRPVEESKVARDEAVQPTCDLERSELRTMIDEEIGRLPERYRRPVVLCYVEGRTHAEAAHRLRCTVGSLRGRLDQARLKLRERLTRRGAAPVAGLGVLALGGESVSAAVPPPLIAGTVATLTHAGTATAVSVPAAASAIDVANSVFRSMVMAKVKVAALVLFGILALGTLPLVVALEPSGPRMPSIQDAAQPARSFAASQRADDRGEGGREQGIVVSGRILDDSGRPIRGAKIRRGYPFGEGFSQAETDVDGRFRFDRVPAGKAMWTIQALGYGPVMKMVAVAPEAGSLDLRPFFPDTPDNKVVAVAPGLAPIEFRLGRGRAIRGRVVDRQGRPLAGASITVDHWFWQGHRALDWQTQTDEEGEFAWDDAPSGATWIGANLDGYLTVFLREVPPSINEVSITLFQHLKVRGTVVAAETRHAVQSFALVPGTESGKGLSTHWDRGQSRRVGRGQYEFVFGDGVMRPEGRRLRIEADGYEPATSRVIRDDEDEPVVNFVLRKGPGISGVVHSPDGAPLAGADVVLAVPSRPALFTNGRPPTSDGRLVVKTGRDGDFAFPPHEPSYTIVALHGRGFGELTVRPEESPLTVEVTMRPWGRIEGTLRVGNRPGARQALNLAYDQRADAAATLVHWDGKLTTDDVGRFVFDRVRPGNVAISREILIKPSSSTWEVGHTRTIDVKVAPDATARVTMGGTGRPVVGRMTAPAGLAGPIDWTCSRNWLQIRAGMQSPPPLFTRGDWTVRPETDGSFRVDDVEAGIYELHIEVNRRSADGAPPGNEPIATARREVIVPEMPGGRSDELLDLGMIPVTAVNKPKPASAERNQ